MDTTLNCSLRFGQGSESKTEMPGRLLNREALQKIAARISLIGLTVGFSVLGTLIIVNRYQADLNEISGGSPIAIVGGIGAILVGIVFLIAACLHLRFCARDSIALQIRRQSHPPKLLETQANHDIRCAVLTGPTLGKKKMNDENQENRGPLIFTVPASMNAEQPCDLGRAPIAAVYHSDSLGSLIC